MSPQVRAMTHFWRLIAVSVYMVCHNRNSWGINICMWEPITSRRVFTWVGTCEEGQRRTANKSWKFETLREFPDTLYRSILCWYIIFLSLGYANHLINWNFCNFAAYLREPLCWFPLWVPLRPWLITVLSSYHWARWRLSLQFVNSYRVFTVLHSCVNKCVHRLCHPGAARMIERRGVPQSTLYTTCQL